MKFLLVLLSLVISAQAFAGSSGMASNDKDAEFYIKPSMVMIEEFLKDPSRNNQPAEYCRVAQFAFYSMDSLLLIPHGGEKERAFARAFHHLELAQCEDGVPNEINLKAESNFLAAVFELRKFWSVKDDSTTASVQVESQN